jgi:hypothetical protein
MSDNICTRHNATDCHRRLKETPGEKAMVTKYYEFGPEDRMSSLVSAKALKAYLRLV